MEGGALRITPQPYARVCMYMGGEQGGGWGGGGTL